MNISSKVVRFAAAVVGVLVVVAAANYFLEFGWFGTRARLVLSSTLLLAVVVIAMAIRNREIGEKMR